MYLTIELSAQIRRSLPREDVTPLVPTMRRALPLESLVSVTGGVEVIGLFDIEKAGAKKHAEAQLSEVGVFDIRRVKVRSNPAVRRKDRVLKLYVGALHVATLEPIHIGGNWRYQVVRAGYSELRFDTQWDTSRPLRLIA